MTNYDVNIILAEMFKRVGREFSPAFIKEEDWFLQESWTHLEEASFKAWVVHLLKTKYHYTKARAENESTWILLHCGWKTKEPEASLNV